jgi:hypothetical protein
MSLGDLDELCRGHYNDDEPRQRGRMAVDAGLLAER